MTSTSGSPAGWHPDPTGAFEQRYWDGSQWTEHVSTAGFQSVSPVGEPPTHDAQQAVQARAVQEHAAQERAVQEQAFQSAQPSQREPVQPEPLQPEPLIRIEPVSQPAQSQPEPVRQQPMAVHPAEPQPTRLEAEPMATQPSHQDPHGTGQVQPTASGTPAGWHPDPTGQFEQRYWDGAQWTEHVAHQGQQGMSPLTAARPAQANVHTSSAEQVQRQVQQQARVQTQHTGGGHLMNEPVLVVNQKAKLIEITQEFAVYDQAGSQLGSVVEVGQSGARKLLRFVSDLDQYLTHKFEVRDQQGTVLLTLLRPAKLMKSKVVVSSPTGQEIGTIRQENVLGKIRFAFEVNGQRIGGIQAENWRAWNFSIVDVNGQEVARITKTWEGLVKAAFTTADNYVVQIHHELPEPLHTLVVASALTVDTALKQDAK